MSANRKFVNEMVTCPFDPAHRLLRSRLQMHIAKCKLNHLDKEMEVCPFNATHQMQRGLLQQHLAKCPDRLPIDQKLCASMDKNNTFKGRTAVPNYTHPLPPCEESWDVDYTATPGYEPPKAPPKDAIVRDLGLMKPAERRNYYRSLHLAESEREEEKPAVVQNKLRQPKQKVEDILPNEMMKKAPVGIGRGMPKSDIRIAADIFNNETAKPSSRQPKSYRDVVNSMNNLNIGIGRGRRPAAASSETEPVVSLGRGIPLSDDM